MTFEAPVSYSFIRVLNILVRANTYIDRLQNIEVDMRSYLWQWFVFSLIYFNYGRSDGKPILSNLIQRVGQGLQKAVRSFRGAPPVSKTRFLQNT